jgi:hypothetical protein
MKFCQEVVVFLPQILFHIAWNVSSAFVIISYFPYNAQTLNSYCSHFLPLTPSPIPFLTLDVLLIFIFWVIVIISTAISVLIFLFL